MKREIKLSKQMKIVLAVSGVLLVLVIGFMMTTGSHPSSTVAVTPPPTPSPSLTPASSRPKGPAAVTLLPGLPAAVKRGLEKHDVVVAIVYGSGDQAAVAPALQGAHKAHVGFAALDVQRESVAQAVELFAPATADPAVVIVRRPGTVTSVLPGYSDADTVAQAAVQPTTPPAAAGTTTTTAAPAPAPAG